MQGSFFAEQLIPSSIWFVNTDMFVVVEKMKAFLFEIQESTPVLANTYNSHSNIIAALPTSSRHQFAILEENGKITFCKIKG